MEVVIFYATIFKWTWNDEHGSNGGMTSEKLGITLKQTAKLFDKFKVLPFVRDCWGIFHVEGDNAVYEEIREYLISKGAAI